MLSNKRKQAELAGTAKKLNFGNIIELFSREYNVLST
jgi:hypothetical protein